jgi:hypothetical protein
MERQIAMETPFLKDSMAAISEMKAQMREREEEIEKVRRMQSPGREDRSGREEEKG